MISNEVVDAFERGSGHIRTRWQMQWTCSDEAADASDKVVDAFKQGGGCIWTRWKMHLDMDKVANVFKRGNRRIQMKRWMHSHEVVNAFCT